MALNSFRGRALAYQLINATSGGLDYTFSSIAKTQNFMDADTPMPILVADGRYPDELVIAGNATVYEFNPWEFGTFDPTIFGFVPMEYLGSNFSDGTLPKNESCVRGFDNGGYIMGSSSSLFNQALNMVNGTELNSHVKDVLNKVLGNLDKKNDDIAVYNPNPFYGYRNDTSPVAGEKDLDIVDGGEDDQNVPLHPLIQPERHVDVIFAIDSSADTEKNWPDGASLVATYERTVKHPDLSNGTVFPAVPDVNTFINNGYNYRPTFFGCDSKNLTGPAPLIVYLPNSPYTFFSNTSTYKMSYDNDERDSMIQNAYDSATMGNSTFDENWSTCVGCAILSRSLERTNTTVPEACTQCFQKYCWDGSTNTTAPGSYYPVLRLDSAAAGVVMPSLVATVVAMMTALSVMM